MDDLVRLDGDVLKHEKTDQDALNLVNYKKLKVNQILSVWRTFILLDLSGSERVWFENISAAVRTGASHELRAIKLGLNAVLLEVVRAGYELQDVCLKISTTIHADRALSSR